jgi:hypothetical protein
MIVKFFFVLITLNLIQNKLIIINIYIITVTIIYIFFMIT